MNWNTPEAGQQNTFAADGENPPVSLSADTFIDSIQIGECSPVLSYEISNKNALVFAHFSSQTLKVEAVATDGTILFSSSTSCPGSYFETIVRCEANDWLIVVVSGVLYIFESLSGTYIGSLSLPAKNIYEASTGEVVVRTTQSSSPYQRIQQLEYDSVNGVFYATPLWVPSAVPGPFTPISDTLVISEYVTGGVDLVAYDLLSGAEQWTQNYPDCLSVTSHGFDTSGDLYCSYLLNDPDTDGAFTKLDKLSNANGAVVWSVDLTGLIQTRYGLYDTGLFGHFLVKQCLGGLGMERPWGAKDPSYEFPEEDPEKGRLDWIPPYEDEIEVAQISICNDAVFVLYTNIAGTDCSYLYSPKALMLDPQTGEFLKDEVLPISGAPLEPSKMMFAANYSGGAWALVNAPADDGSSLSILGLGLDRNTVTLPYSEDSTLPFAGFENGCIVDGAFYYPYYDSQLSETRINILGDPYVSDRDLRNCRKTDCCSECTTFAEYVLCIGAITYKSCLHTQSPSSLGYGWQLEHYKYVEERANGDLVYHDGTGMFERWIRDNDKFFPAHPDNYIEAVLNTDNSYSLRHPDGSVMTFDPNSKRIVSWVDTNDNTVTYHYETTGDKRLILIEDGEGRETHLDYGTRNDGQPVSITSHTPSQTGLTAKVTLFEYYPSGETNENRLKKTTNPEGETTEFLYNADGQIESIKDTRDQIAREYSYYTDGRIKDITYYGESRSTFTHDVINRSLKTVTVDLTDANVPSRESIVFYDEYHNIIESRQKVDDLTWNITYLEYTSPVDPYLLTKETRPNGAISTYNYTARGNLKSSTDPQGNVTTYSYMEEDDTTHPIPDLVTRIRRPLRAGEMERATTNFTYDNKGNLLKVTDALGNDVKYTYFADGRVHQIENQLGDITVYTYEGEPHDNSFRHLQKVEIPTDTGTREIDYVFDDFDNLLEVSNELDEKVTYTYDKLDRILSVEDPEGAISQMHYQDGLIEYTLLPPNQGSETTPRQATPVYDSLGRIQHSKMATGPASELIRASFEYTGFSELKSLSRPKGDTTPAFFFQYDRLGRPTTSTDPLSKSSTVAYEPFCEGRAVTSARGVRQKMDFDTRCLLTQLTTGDIDPNDPLEVVQPRVVRAFEYDELGRMVKSLQSPNDILSGSRYGAAIAGTSRYGSGLVPSDGERLYEYDDLDRLLKITFEDGQHISYAYDEASRLKQRVDIDNNITEFEYRPDHLLKTLKVKRDSQADRVFTYHYDIVGRLSQVDYPSESEIIVYFDDGSSGSGWDRNGRLKHLRYELGGTEVRAFAYEYDPSGNRTFATETTGGITTVYKYHYDWLDRLIKVEKGPTKMSVTPVSIYTYDDSDNPTKLESPNQFLEYDFTFDDASNVVTRQETETSGSTVNFIENFTSDDDGNLLTRTRTLGADTHQIVYEWDDFNKLVAVSASLNGSPATEHKQQNAYGVNGFRRQKTKKDGEIVTEYAEGLATAVAKSQTGKVTYIHGHQILGFDQAGQFYYFLTDALGSVRDIVDGSGNVVQRYHFDERGNHQIPPLTGGPASAKTFVGGLSVNDDTEDSNLYLMGHRFYDPSLGRFLNRDPIGFAGGLNLFSYGGNNPVTMTDHTGLFVVGPTPVDIAVGLLVLALLVDAATGGNGPFGSMQDNPALHNQPGNADAVATRAKEMKRRRQAAGYNEKPCPDGLFHNQLPGRLQEELATARSVGAQRIRPGTPEFAMAVSQGKIKWVVTDTGELIITPHHVQGVEISHAFLSIGLPVLSAGEADIAYADGEYFGIEIDPHSGHYKPTKSSVDTVGRAAFRKAGITFP